VDNKSPIADNQPMSDKPGPIEPTKTMTIAGGLYAEAFLPAVSPKGVVLITHGYAEHCGRYREVAHVIVNAGWAALSYDVRGHGHSPGARGFIEHFDMYLDDLRAAADAARQLAPGMPFVLLGHSHGALITLRALTSDRPPQATHAILSSPYLELQLKVPGYRKLLARFASKIAPGLDQPSHLRADQLTQDPEKQAEWAADKLNFPTANARWFTEASDAQRYVAEHADRIQIPTTWLVAGADPLCVPAATKRIAARVKHATYHDLVGLRHEVFNETERGKVFAELTNVLAQCAASSAAQSA
jgi:alpha-beta hydrolase superfamily lysophospholipase